MDEAIRRSVAAWERMQPLHWHGLPCQQLPSDMLRYAEVLRELRPPWVAECGTADGGTALFLADMLQDARGMQPVVITIDSDPRPAGNGDPRVTFLKGDAADPDLVAWLAGQAGGTRGVVLLDDDHSCAHVLAELDLWAPLADYLIVEDTLTGYLPQYPDNPRLALEKWLPGHPEFAQDPDPDPTNHPGGWLRRVAG